MQVHITCVETGSGVAKAGLWYPCSNRVECHAQCCAGKTVEERTMRCGGLHSFETHCGKNPKQNHWKQTFKVNEEGVLCCAVLCCAVLCCAVPCHFAPWYIGMWCAAVCSAVLCGAVKSIIFNKAPTLQSLPSWSYLASLKSGRPCRV